MKKFSKIFFYLTAVVLLSWLLPWLLQFAASKPGNDPFTLYSCVTKRFAYIQSSKDNGVKRYDANGTEYTVAQFDSILPTFYYRQLFSKDRLPDTINGKEVTPKIIAHGNFTFKQSARDVNVTKPALWNRCRTGSTSKTPSKLSARPIVSLSSICGTTRSTKKNRLYSTKS